MGKPQNKKGWKNTPSKTANSKPNTPQMKKTGKQTPTPKSQPVKKITMNDSSSDEMNSSSNSFDEDFEALLKGPPKNTKAEEKIPKLVPAKANGEKDKTPKQNDKTVKSPKAVTPGKADPGNKTPAKAAPEKQTPGKQTPGKAVPGKQTPGKQASENKTPGKPAALKETPGKAVPGKQTPGKATPVKKQAGQKTPDAKATGVENSAQKKTPVGTSALKDKKQKRKRDDSSDEEEILVATKLARTSNTPEKVTPPAVAVPGKTMPSKPATPIKLAGEKSKAPEAVAVQNKKRQYEESDDEEEEESQAKKLKAETAAGKDGSTSQATADIVAQDLQFKAKIERCTLFIKNFTNDVTEKDVRALSKDIEEVQLRNIFSKKVNNQSYAYLRFKDEKTADANYKLLSNKNLCGSQIVVDYVGEKSKNASQLKAKSLSIEEIDPLRLYIRGINKNTTEADLKKLFPTAESVAIPLKKKDNTPIGYAFAGFKSEEACRAAHDSMQGKVIDAKILVVLFARKCSQPKAVPAILQPAKPKSDATAVVKAEAPAVNKKTKPAKKEEKEEDDEDDDEEDDDDDEEDDDDEDDDEGDDDEEEDEDDDEDDEDDDEDDDDEDEDDEDDE